MNAEAFRVLIEAGNLEGLRGALASDPELANTTIRWFHHQQNESDPLHYVSDCVSRGLLVNGREGEIATLLLESGAAIDGSAGRETPLIGAASLGAENVARVLVEAGAALEASSVFGARALHWAAWTGSPGTVGLLVSRGAQIEARCREFGATPLFWAVHACGPDGPHTRKDPVGAARILITAGARVDTGNRQGVAARDLARQVGSSGMAALFD